MNAAELYLETIRRSDDSLKRALDDLSIEELRNQPAGPGSNPIGWLVWHLTQTRDSIIASVAGTPTVWERDGWGARFGIEGEQPRFVPDDVHKFDPKSFETLVGYFDSVVEDTSKTIGGLSDVDLTRLVESAVPGRPPQSVGSRLGIILNDNIQHIGQVAYLRGLIRGHGWF